MCAYRQIKPSTSAFSLALFLIILLSASLLFSSSLRSREPYLGYQELIARIFVPSSAQAPAQNTTESVYENSTYGIKMQHPSGWDVREFNNSAAAPTKLVAAFVSPIGLQSVSDRVPESVVVGVENLSSRNMGLGPYTTIQLSLLSESTQGFNLIESLPTTIANNPAHQIVYTETLGPLKLKKMQIWTVMNGMAYIIIYSAEESSYSDQLPTVQKMLDSFNIIKTASPVTNSTR